jgi:hypothetical protein
MLDGICESAENMACAFSDMHIKKQTFNRCLYTS